jgi:hypothetical protein
MFCANLGGIVAHLNIVKLCVGADSVQDLLDWHSAHRTIWPRGTTRHITRMQPKRAAEVLDGGSLYWVIKGIILARQRFLDLTELRGEDGILRCGFILDAEVILTAAAPRRAFQGWRYLAPADSPPDLPKGRASEQPLPDDLARALAEMGLQ